MSVPAMPVSGSSPTAAWPALPLDGWRDTYATLHRWAQIVGKTRLALAPMENHWWQVALYVTVRGLTTSPMPMPDGTGRTVSVEFDFIEHALVLQRSDGAAGALPLVAQSVAAFYEAYRSLLHAFDVPVRFRPVPVEIEIAVPFVEDRTHASYDPAAAHRCWQALVQADRVLKRFRGRFQGKASPVHFFWGSFDLAATRFSGRRAPRHPGGVPNCPDYVMIEAYSHECSSCGFWPGNAMLPEPAFYAYAYPAPEGFPDYPVVPGARYEPALGEFILPYDTVRAAAAPDDLLLEFFQQTYDAAATLGHWDRVHATA